MLLLVVALGLAVGAVRAQGPRGLRAEGPARVAGDGSTTFEVVVRNAPRGSAVANADVFLDSGRLIARRELDDGAMVLELMPPRVVEPSVMTVSVRIQGLGRAEHAVALTPVLGEPGRFRSEGALALDVPARLILGLDQAAEIRFRNPGGNAVRLYASAGLLSAPSSKDGTLSVAKYLPPQSKFPALVVIVAASDDGSFFDWAPIRLFGRPSIATRSEANATVTVRIDNESFGPIRADKQGRGTMRVLVPPGVTHARVLARDALGNESTVPLDLGTPASPQLFTLCPAESERLYTFALDGTGRPLRGAGLVVTSSLGELSAPRRVQGYSVSTLGLTPSAAMDAPLVFFAEIVGEPESRTRCDSRVVGEAPIRMKLSATPSSWNPTMGQEVKVRVELGFAGHRTARVVPVIPTVDFGEIAAVEAPNPATYELTWRLPSRLDGRTLAHLTLQTDTANPVSAKLELALAPGPPETVVLRFGSERLVANGLAETTLDASVQDQFGNPARSVELVATATGSVSRFRVGPGGELVATYRAPRSLHLSSDIVEIRVRDSPLRATTAIALEPVREVVRVFGRVGYGLPLGKLSGPAASVGAAYRLPVLDGGLFVATELGLSSEGETRRDASDTEDVELSALSLPIGLGLHYELQWSSVSPYVELGPKLAITRVRVSSESSGELDGWTTASGVSLALGLLVPLGPGAVTVGSQYLYLPIDWGGITGNIGGLFAGAGYVLEI